MDAPTIYSPRVRIQQQIHTHTQHTAARVQVAIGFNAGRHRFHSSRIASLLVVACSQCYVRHLIVLLRAAAEAEQHLLVLVAAVDWLTLPGVAAARATSQSDGELSWPAR